MEGSVFEYEVGPPDGVNENVADLHDKLDEDDELARRRILHTDVYRQQCPVCTPQG
jgi:hypothetical protein